MLVGLFFHVGNGGRPLDYSSRYVSNCEVPSFGSTMLPMACQHHQTRDPRQHGHYKCSTKVNYSCTNDCHLKSDVKPPMPYLPAFELPDVQKPKVQYEDGLSPCIKSCTMHMHIEDMGLSNRIDGKLVRLVPLTLVSRDGRVLAKQLPGPHPNSQPHMTMVFSIQGLGKYWLTILNKTQRVHRHMWAPTQKLTILNGIRVFEIRNHGVWFSQ